MLNPLNQSGITIDELSGSVDGQPILITAVATLGQTIHQAVSGTAEPVWDVCYLYGVNNDSVAHNVTIEYGDAVTGHNIVVAIPVKGSQPYPVLPGFILRNAKVITAFADSGSKVSLIGWVNHMN